MWKGEAPAVEPYDLYAGYEAFLTLDTLERIDRNQMDRNFIVAMFLSTKVMMVAHLELTGRNQCKSFRRGGRCRFVA